MHYKLPTGSSIPLFYEKNMFIIEVYTKKPKKSVYLIFLNLKACQFEIAKHNDITHVELKNN